MLSADTRYGLPLLVGTCALVASASFGGCSSRGAKKIPRSKDAAAVVVVEQTPSGVTFSDEKEPNDTAESAAALSAPCGVRGTLDGATDVDHYAVKVGAAGVLSVRVGGIEGVDLVVELRDAKGETLARSDRGPALTSEGVPNYPVGEGTYHVVVSEFVKKAQKAKRGKKKVDEAPAGRQGPSPPYELVVQLEEGPAEGHEVEPNESAETARELLIGDEAFGYIGWADDVDVWALSLEGFSPQYALEVDLSPIEGVWLTVELVDGEGNVVARRQAERGAAVRLHNLVPAEGADRYYARITARRSNPDERYSLRPSRRLLDLDEEVEPNDSAEAAMSLSEDTKEAAGSRRGFLTPGDVDWFRLPARSEAGLLTVSIEAPTGVDAKLEVATEKGEALGESDRGKRGESESLAAVPVAAGTAVLVKITGKGDAEASYYELRWSLSPGQASSESDPLFDEYDD